MLLVQGHPRGVGMRGRETSACMQVKRATIAKLLAVAFVFNLVVMGGGALLAYQSAPPIPDEVAGPDGETIVTGEEIRDGKKTFQQDGLMNHGSILRAFERPAADEIVDAAREQTMAGSLTGLLGDGAVVAVVGFEHLDGLEAQLETSGLSPRGVDEAPLAEYGKK